MQSELLYQALTVIKSEQHLVNVISQRVRQLTMGARPMIEVGPRMGFSDIALTEVIKGKLTFTLAPAPAPEPPIEVPLLPAFAKEDRVVKTPVAAH